MIGLCYEHWQHFVNLWDIHDMLQECLSCSLKIERFGIGANQSIGIAFHRLWCSCDSANRLSKELNSAGVLAGKAFCLEFKCSVLVISLLNTRSTASLKNNSIDMNIWLSLAFLPSIGKIESDFHFKTDIHWKLSAAISKVGDLLYQIQMYTLHLKI